MNTLPRLPLDELRMLALAMLVDEGRVLERLDGEVRVALGMRARRGRLRLDDLSCRLVQLIDSSEIWRARAQAARRRVARETARTATGRRAA